MRRPLSHLVVSAVLWAALLATAHRAAGQPCPDPLPPDAPTVGYWGPVLEFGVEAVHMVLLKNEKVLVIDRSDAPSQCMLFSPPYDAGSVGPVFSGPAGENTHRLYCTAHAGLFDGKILFSGGIGDTANRNTIYNPDLPAPDSWIPADLFPLGT